MLTKPKTAKQAYWLKHLTAVYACDDSLSKYAIKHGLKIKALYQWKSKLTKLGLCQALSVGSRSAFIEVRTRPPEPLQKETCTITLDNGNRIEFIGALDTTTIRTIIASVGLKR
jgi:hypothetical protein